MSNASIPARFTYSQWRHGGWYVNEVRYPSGAIGCVSRNYPDGKWRIVCGNHDATFPTREAAARAEFEIAAAQCAAAEAAKAAPPAAPVASDPVPADVPAYLAVSTDAAGVETVMGVFQVADHASPQAAEMEAGNLCERIQRASPGAACHVRANPDVNAAFADLATAEHTLRNLSADSTVWGAAFDKREAARERAVSLDPIRFARTYPSQAFAFRHLLPADMVARIEAAEDDAAMRAAVGAPAMVPLGGRYVALADGGVEWVADAPTMVPQPAQQQQANAGGPRGTVPVSNAAYRAMIAARDSGRVSFPEGVLERAFYHSHLTRAQWQDVCRRMRADAHAPAMVPQPCQPQQGRAAGPALEVDPVATARSYGFKIEPRAVFEAEPELPEGLRERAASYQGAWVFYDLEDNSDGFLLVGSDPEAIAADWYSGHGCDYEGAPVMRPVRMVPQLSQPQQGRAAPNGFYAFQARGERPEPARPMGPQDRDGITPQTIQAQTVQVRTRAEWYAFHHACRHLARQRMASGRAGEHFWPANICGRMHRLDVSRLSITYRVERGEVRPVLNGSQIALKTSMISARPRRALIAFELEWAARYRKNAARDVLHSHRRALAIKAARASIAEARSLATNFNRLPE